MDYIEYIIYATKCTILNLKGFRDFNFVPFITSEAYTYKEILNYVNSLKKGSEPSEKDFESFLQAKGKDIRSRSFYIKSYKSIISDIEKDKEENKNINIEAENVFNNIKSYYKKMALKKACLDILSDEKFTSDDSYLDDKDLLSIKKKLKKSLLTLDDQYDPVLEKNKMKDGEGWVEDYISDFNERNTTIQYKFYDNVLDSLIFEGPVPGNGGIITASTGMAKSAYCLHLVNQLTKNFVPVMYNTLEMSKTQVMDRLLSSRTGIPYKDIVKPTSISYKETLSILEPELQKIRDYKLLRISENPSTSLDQLKDEISEFQEYLRSIGKSTYFILILDLLTMIKDFCKSENGVNFAQQIELAMNELNGMAKTFGFSYIGVVQLNRSTESLKVTSLQSIEQLRPMRSSIKNSNAILERARWCVSLFRKKYYADMYLSKDIADQLEDIVELTVLKQNNGEVGTRHLLFDGTTFSFNEIVQDISI